MTVKTYTGSCHCGAIRFEADLDLAEGSNRCNCSYCAKARAWFTFAKGAERFRLLDGRGVSEYRWTPPGDTEPHLTYAFCRVCGIRTHVRGEHPPLGGTFYYQCVYRNASAGFCTSATSNRTNFSRRPKYAPSRTTPTKTEIVTRTLATDGLANRSRCEAHARDLRKLPDREGAVVIERRRVDLPSGFDTIVEVGIVATVPARPRRPR